MKGIIFSTGLIPKILDNTKTQTRRTWGLEKVNKSPDDWTEASSIPKDQLLYESYKAIWRFGGVNNKFLIIRCPYGGVGDRLWVRETHYITPDKKEVIGYVADGDYPHNCSYRIKPSIHMFRKDSRITRKITNVRPERLQDITDADIKAEGFPWRSSVGAEDMQFGYRQPREWFTELWDSLNAKRGYGWEFNPWVWKISFKMG